MSEGRPKSTAAQIVSAITSAIAAGAACAIVGATYWAIFYSPASKALVDWLQTELTMRNQQIVMLEARAGDLNRAIASQEESLRSQQAQLTQGETDIKSLKDERLVLQRERDALPAQNLETMKALSQSAQLLVHQKLVSLMFNYLGKTSVTVINSIGQNDSVSIDIWKNFLEELDSHIGKLPVSDRELAGRIKTEFLKQCTKHRSKVFKLPVSSAKNHELISKQVFDANQALEDCFATFNRVVN